MKHLVIGLIFGFFLSLGFVFDKKMNSAQTGFEVALKEAQLAPPAHHELNIEPQEAKTSKIATLRSAPRISNNQRRRKNLNSRQETYDFSEFEAKKQKLDQQIASRANIVPAPSLPTTNAEAEADAEKTVDEEKTKAKTPEELKKENLKLTKERDYYKGLSQKEKTKNKISQKKTPKQTPGLKTQELTQSLVKVEPQIEAEQATYGGAQVLRTSITKPNASKTDEPNQTEENKVTSRSITILMADLEKGRINKGDFFQEVAQHYSNNKEVPDLSTLNELHEISPEKTFETAYELSSQDENFQDIFTEFYLEPIDNGSKVHAFFDNLKSDNPEIAQVSEEWIIHHALDQSYNHSPEVLRAFEERVSEIQKPAVISEIRTAILSDYSSSASTDTFQL